MNNALRTTLAVIGVITLAALLLLTGFWTGRAAPAGWGPNGMMDTYADYGPGMMANYGMQNGTMMGSGNMMGGGGMMGGGMMDNSGLYETVQPLSLDAAEQALSKFLDSNETKGLAIGEIMIFDNHAYAQIVEEATGIGAMEVLVDPVTLAVYPEHGPNMMWNLKYGMMAEYSEGVMGMGRMMGYDVPLPSEQENIDAEMPVSPEQAVESAQKYLDASLPGAVADAHADPFYGYYTLHVLRDAEVVGMLSVNGYSRQVFLHTWHGEFIEMRGE